MTPNLIAAERSQNAKNAHFGQTAYKIHYNNLCMKSSASKSKAFQSRSKGEIPGRARRKERLSRSKLKQAFLTDSDAEPFHVLNSMYQVRLIKSSAYEPGLIETI